MQVLILLGESTIPSRVRLVKKNAKEEAVAWLTEMEDAMIADWAENYPEDPPMEHRVPEVSGDCVFSDDIFIQIMLVEEWK